MKRFIFAIVLVILLNVPTALFASSSEDLVRGNRSYAGKQYDKAIAEYAKVEPDSGLYWKAGYNAGNANYMKGAFERSIDSYNRALSSGKLEAAGPSDYNIGNAYYRLGANAEKSDIKKAKDYYETSLGYYKRAMDLNEKDFDAKYNYEFVSNKILQLKEKVDKQQKQEEKKDKKKDKNKDQQKDQNKDQSKDQNKDKQNKDNNGGQGSQSEQSAGQGDKSDQSSKQKDSSQRSAQPNKSEDQKSGEKDGQGQGEPDNRSKDKPENQQGSSGSGQQDKGSDNKDQKQEGDKGQQNQDKTGNEDNAGQSDNKGDAKDGQQPEKDNTGQQNKPDTGKDSQRSGGSEAGKEDGSSSGSGEQEKQDSQTEQGKEGIEFYNEPSKPGEMSEGEARMLLEGYKGEEATGRSIKMRRKQLPLAESEKEW